MLRLPPAIRHAIAVRCYGSISQQYSAVTPLNFTAFNNVPSHFRRANRPYATLVESKDDQWNKHGKAAPPQSDAASQETASSDLASQDSEVQHLLALIDLRMVGKGPAHRSLLSQQRDDAMKAADPVRALSGLARSPGIGGVSYEGLSSAEEELLVATIEAQISRASSWKRPRKTIELKDAMKATDSVQALKKLVYRSQNVTSALSSASSPEVESPEADSSITEKDRLLARIRRRLSQKPARKRPPLRASRDEALKAADPIPALKELAYPYGEETGESPSKTPEAIEEPKPKPVTEPTAQSVQLMDIQRIQNTMSLPTKDEYPTAPSNLFHPLKVSDAVSGACGKLKLSMQTSVDFTRKKRMSPESQEQTQKGLGKIWVCNLKFEIPDVCQEIAIGEGAHKVSAKQAAWLQLLSKLHTDGTLKQLIPASYQESEAVDGVKELPEDLPEPVEIDEVVMKEERDAKIEIYNYAAGLGVVPIFETKLRLPRPRAGRKMKTKSLFQVSIKLESQNISVTAFGKDISTAEVAAALEFKRKAEGQRSGSDGRAAPLGPSTILTVETAPEFFEFYKQQNRSLNLEMEHDLDSKTGQNNAQLTLNGKSFGQIASMKSKKQAESVAYLTAALEITSSNPQLLEQFEQSWKENKGRILRPVGSLDLHVEHDALRSMRDALVEARAAGLPDTRQALTAEVVDAQDQFVHRVKRLSPSELQFANDDLSRKQEAFNHDKASEELRAQKASLPMSEYRDQVLRTVSQNVYSIIFGATGSGKTSQVPQILLEDAIANGRGGSCNIVCTQPRRIAATSMAKRVTAERMERLQTTVGYHVRFDVKQPRQPYGITFCTTGILLEKLKHHPHEILDTTSHLIIDEVHERDLNIDFLMIVLKKAIHERQLDGRSVPKVVLMSATLDMELFAKYFEQTDGNGKRLPCPSLSVPGRTFPVEEKYLGSIMDELYTKYGREVQPLLNLDRQSTDFLAAETKFSAAQSGTHERRGSASVIDWKRERQSTADSNDEISIANEKEEALVPISLVVATIAHLCKTTDDGAILAFFPGLQEILQTQTQLRSQSIFGLNFANSSKFKICLLHSTVPKEQQDEIFEPPPPGCRKIILSTNIAETSITVTDVKYVVDTGKLREKRYDQARRITKLQCVWTSKSNAKQRAGRAGRVQDGFYYALYSKERADSFVSIGLPELLRSDLQETCLSITAQKFNEPVGSFLGQAIQPPSTQAVNAAVQDLISNEAYTADESLTPLGRLLSQLPVHPKLGKMIILGVIFKCLDPMIVLGAAAEERSLFVSPIESRVESKRIHQSYAAGYQSDHIAFLKAFDELRRLKSEYGYSAMERRARENFLHVGAFKSIEMGAAQIQQVLVDANLIALDMQKETQFGPLEMNRNADNLELVKALLLAGCHPNLAVKTSSDGLGYRTAREHGVLMHIGSLNAEPRKSSTIRHAKGSLYAYDTLAKSNDGHSLSARTTTAVSPLMPILFGGQLRMSDNGRLTMDEWLPFFVKSQNSQFATKLILEFRKGLERVLNLAFHSLSHANADGPSGLASDPMRDRFAARVVQVLHHSAQVKFQQAFTGLDRLSSKSQRK